MESTPLVGDPYAKRIEVRSTTLRIRTRRVFKPRIWLGLKLMKFALWVGGSTAEAIE